jgi:hypothetical protein
VALVGGLAALAAVLALSVFPDELLGPFVLARLRAGAAEAGYDLTVASLRGVLARQTRLVGVVLTARDPRAILVGVTVEQVGVVVSAWDLARGRDDALSAVQAGGVHVQLVLDGPSARGPDDADLTLPERLPAVELDGLYLHCRVVGERALSVRDARLHVEAPAAGGGAQAVTLDAPSCVLEDLPVGTRAFGLGARGSWNSGTLTLQCVLADDAPLLADARIELPTAARGGQRWDLPATLLDGTLALRGDVTDGLLTTAVEARELSIAELAALFDPGAADGSGPAGRLACQGELRIPDVFGAEELSLARVAAELHVSARELRVPDAVVRGAFAREGGAASLDPRTLEVDVALRDGALVLADGMLATPGGRLLLRHGRLTLDAATLAEQVVELDCEADFPDLAALGAVFGGPAWGGRLAGAVRVGGPLAELLAEVDLAGEGVVIADRALGHVALVARADRRTLHVAALNIDGEALRLAATGRIDLGTATLRDVLVRAELRAGPRAPVPGVDGTLVVSLSAEGPLRDPAATTVWRSRD